MPKMTHNVVHIRMNLKTPFRILALLLAFSLTGGMVLQEFADYGLPCCGAKACHLDLEATTPDGCHLNDNLITEIKSTSCHMNKALSLETVQGAYLRPFRPGRPEPGVHAVLFYEFSLLSSLFMGPVRRPLNLARAAPEPLFLQNLTLLI
jgi:hypothetical protein